MDESVGTNLYRPAECSKLHSWLHTRGATLIVFLLISIEMPYAGDALSYYIVAKVEIPLFPGCFAAWEPPTCSYLPFSENTRFYGLNRGLSSASRSRRRSEKANPFRTSTLFRIAAGRQSHTIFVQRGSVCVFEPKPLSPYLCMNKE